MSSYSGPSWSLSWVLAPSAITLAARMNRASFAAYSGIRSPSRRTARKARTMSSQPFSPRMSTGPPSLECLWVGVDHRRRLLAAGLQRHSDIELLAVPTHPQGDLVADRLGPDRDDQLVVAGHRAALEGEDDVTGLQPGRGGRALGVHGGFAVDRTGGDLDALAGVALVQVDTDDGVLGLAGADELLGGAADLVARDGEADADVAGLGGAVGARDARDGAVDADHPALHVQERTAGVAGVDGSVGLDRVDERLSRGAPRGHRPVERRDDPARHGALQTERCADGDQSVADRHLRGPADRQRLQRHAGDLDDRQVVGQVAADDGGIDLLAAGQLDDDLAAVGRGLDDVVVGDDVALVVEGPARSGVLTGAGTHLDGDHARQRTGGDARDAARWPGDGAAGRGGRLVRGAAEPQSAGVGEVGPEATSDEAGEDRRDRRDAEHGEPARSEERRVGKECRS